MTETDGNTPVLTPGAVFYGRYKAAHPWGEELEAFGSVSAESQAAMEAGAEAVAAPLREEIAALRAELEPFRSALMEIADEDTELPHVAGIDPLAEPDRYELAAIRKRARTALDGAE